MAQNKKNNTKSRASVSVISYSAKTLKRVCLQKYIGEGNACFHSACRSSIQRKAEKRNIAGDKKCTSHVLKGLFAVVRVYALELERGMCGISGEEVKTFGIVVKFDVAPALTVCLVSKTMLLNVSALSEVGPGQGELCCLCL